MTSALSYVSDPWSPTGIYTSSPVVSTPTIGSPLAPAVYGAPSIFPEIEKDKELKKLLMHCLESDYWIRRTGSQLIEGSIPNDYDYVVEDTDGSLNEWLGKNGWWRGGSDRPESEFISWKIVDNANVLNVIVCNNREYFRKYLMATELLKKLQPQTKQERIDIFDMILKGGKESEVPF